MIFLTWKGITATDIRNCTHIKIDSYSICVQKDSILKDSVIFGSFLGLDLTMWVMTNRKHSKRKSFQWGNEKHHKAIYLLRREEMPRQGIKRAFAKKEVSSQRGNHLVNVRKAVFRFIVISLHCRVLQFTVAQREVLFLSGSHWMKV